MSLLIVGIGNTLRRDDGAGAALVERFSGRANCRVLITHQLLPEHCEELVRCDRVVFVDAAVNTEEVIYDSITPCRHSPTLGHTGDPAWLLSLCRSIHDRSPEAWLLTIPATDLGFGEGLSAAAADAVIEAARLLERQITK